MKKNKKDLSAMIDLNTGKIYGTEPGTYSWWHEQGHWEYNNSERGLRNRFKQSLIFDIFLVSLIASVVWKYFAFVSATLFLIYKGFDLYEEKWANNYAKEMVKKYPVE